MKKIGLFLILCLCGGTAFAVQNAELAFLQRMGLEKAETARQDRSFAASLAREAGAWAAAHPQDPQAKTALLMAADNYMRAQEEGRALVALYQVHFFFPSQNDTALLSSNVEKAMDEFNRKQKAQALKLLAVPGEGATRQQRHAQLLQVLVKSNLQKITEPVTELFEAYFAAYPQDSANDKMTLLYGDWLRQNGNYYAALLQYRKVSELFPNTPYQAASLRMAADVYAGDLKQYEVAVALYNRVLKEYPTSNERGVVYKHLAVMEENRKDYAAALAYYEKAIADLGAQPAAYEAWRGKADVLAKTKDYQAAYDTLLNTAEEFAADEDKYVSSLTAAAELAERRLKALPLQSAALEKIRLNYSKTHQAPEILYTLGYSYEKQGKTAVAAQTYKQLIINYPTDRYADRAQSRLGRLEK